MRVSLAGQAELADSAVAVEVFVETQFDASHQPRWHLVVATLLADNGSKFGMEVECLQAVVATTEMCLDSRTNPGRELAVEERF
jgi:hypothetical protein